MNFDWHEKPSADDARMVRDYLLHRSKVDLEFRQALLAHPRYALQEALGLDLPGDFSIRFVENAGADLTVILPDPEVAMEELSDEELEHLSGGAWGITLLDALQSLIDAAARQKSDMY